MIIPVITLWQPWASWIMWGWKGIETRTHDRLMSLVGQEKLGIHSGRRFDDSDFVINNPYLTSQQIIDSMNTPTGVVLGTVNCYDGKCGLNESHEKSALIECRTYRSGLFLKNPKIFKTPIPMKGELGIWYLDLSTMQKVKKPKSKLHSPTLF